MLTSFAQSRRSTRPPPRIHVSPILALASLALACATTPASPPPHEPTPAPTSPATPPSPTLTAPPAVAATLLSPTAPPTVAATPPAPDRPLPRDVAASPNLLPAGRCAFAPYLGPACGDTRERHAVVLTVTADEATAEAALHRGPALGLAAGYPFAATLDEMPAHDRTRRGIAVVAGLFADEPAAAAYAAHFPPGFEILELASPEEAAKRSSPQDGTNWNDFEKTRTAVVEIAEDTPAWTSADLEVLEARLDEQLGKQWVRLPAQKVRRARALAALAPACSIPRGQVFATDQARLYDFSRNYAPARCEDGRDVWVPWRATRRESVVTRTRDAALIHQVVLVECDQAVLETRRYAAPSTDKPLRVRSGHGC